MWVGEGQLGGWGEGEGFEGPGSYFHVLYGPVHAACTAERQQGKLYLENWMLDGIAFM